MSEMNHNRIDIDPNDVEGALQKLALIYDLDSDTLGLLRRVIQIFPHTVTLYVDESNAFTYRQTPLDDKFTFNMQTDELILFSRDPMTFIDALVEMAMYLVGFTTLMGVEQYWKVEFAIGSWKPVKNHIKRELGIPVLDEPLWVVGLPPSSPEGFSPEDPSSDDPHPFRTLVSQLDIASFTQMVRLAARDDVEVNFPVGADPRVIQVYIRFKTAMYQVGEGLGLDGWQEFNRRILMMVQDLEEEYRPEMLPVPAWWRQQDEALDSPADPVPPSAQTGQEPADRFTKTERPARKSTTWNPFEAYIEELFNDDE